MSLNPRDYQRSAIDAIHGAFADHQRVLCVLPTGAGKTVIAAHVADSLLPNGRVMVVAHRDELIRQAIEKFTEVTGVNPSIEKAELWSDEESLHGKPSIVVSSVQTLNSGNGTKRMQRFNPDDFAMLWYDEAHHCVSDTGRRVVDHFCANPKLKTLGVTATADRADGEGLGQVFQTCAYRLELPQIVQDGYLVPIHQRRVFIEGLDFSQVRTTAGDLNAGDLEAAMMYEKPLHGVVHATIELACGLEQGSLEPLKDDPARADKLSAMLSGRPMRRTLIFTVSVAHAERIAEIVNRWIPNSAEHVDGGMASMARLGVLDRFRSGQRSFLANCMIAVEGFDMPAVEVIVQARPTKSRALYTQQCGRGTRPLTEIAHHLGELPDAESRRAAIAQSDKPFMDVLDFAGNSGRHKLVTAIDVLGDERYEPEVIDRANEIAQDESIDVETALVRAEEEVNLDRAVRQMEASDSQERIDALDEEMELRRQAEIANRAKVVATADYRVKNVNPFDTFDRSAAHDDGQRRDGASEKQIGFLIHLGVKRETAMGYGRKQASAVISNILAKRREAVA